MMNKRNAVLTLSLSLLSSCNISVLPDNSKYAVDFSGWQSEILIRYMIVHSSEGKIVKEDGEFYFVDEQNRFYVSIDDETEVYIRDNRQTQDHSVIQDGKNCIAVMDYYHCKTGHQYLNIEEPKRYDMCNNFLDWAFAIYFDAGKDTIIENYGLDNTIVWH